MAEQEKNDTPSTESINRDFQRKTIFSYFLPYGILPRPAFNAVLPHAATYDVVYDPEVPLEKMAQQCLDRWEVNSNQINVMERACYIQGRVFSTKVQEVKLRSFYLTPASMNLLAGVLDWEAEYLRREQATEKTGKASTHKNIVCYLPSLAEQRLLGQLETYRAGMGISSEHDEAYEQLLCDAVCCWNVTMLGTFAEQSGQVSLIGHSNIDQRIQFTKLASIVMMFRQNQYLTFMDRRPLDTNWTIRGVSTEQEFQTKLSEGKVDVPIFTAHCLREWYRKYPDSYLFSDPGKLLSDNYEEWISTPVFYSLVEIPGYLKSAEEIGIKGQAAQEKRNTLRSTAIGIGISVYVNYLIYFMPHGKFRWNIGIEKNATKYIFELMKKLYLEKSIPGFERSIDHAIMYFENVYQFSAIFADLLEPSSSRHHPGHIPMPFVRMFLVPVNSSGLQQLRMLMEFTPYEFQRTVVRDICEIDQEYARKNGTQPLMYPTNDPDYPLSYKNRPVLFAYDLEIRRLRQALISYQLGKKFYVACYPEQVRFIRRIMPNVEFI